MKIEIGSYYEDVNWSRVYKCIDKEDSVYFFKRVDDGSYGDTKCDDYDESSKLCKKCTKETVCFEYGRIEKLREIPRLKAILLYGE